MSKGKRTKLNSFFIFPRKLFSFSDWLISGGIMWAMATEYHYKLYYLLYLNVLDIPSFAPVFYIHRGWEQFTASFGKLNVWLIANSFQVRKMNLT